MIYTILHVSTPGRVRHNDMFMSWLRHCACVTLRQTSIPYKPMSQQIVMGFDSKTNISEVHLPRPYKSGKSESHTDTPHTPQAYAISASC